MNLNKLIEINSKEIEILLNEFISKICHRDDDGEISEYSEQVIKDLIYHLNLILPKSIQSGYELGIKECIELTDKSKLPDPNPYGKWVSIKNVNKILTILGGQLQSLLKGEK